MGHHVVRKHRPRQVEYDLMNLHQDAIVVLLMKDDRFDVWINLTPLF